MKKQKGIIIGNRIDSSQCTDTMGENMCIYIYICIDSIQLISSKSLWCYRLDQYTVIQLNFLFSYDFRWLIAWFVKCTYETGLSIVYQRLIMLKNSSSFKFSMTFECPIIKELFYLFFNWYSQYIHDHRKKIFW